MKSDPDLQPTLVGEEIELRPTRPSDWDGLYAAASDRLIWAQHPSPDRWQEPIFRAFFEAGLASGNCLTVRERATGRIIGSSRYSRDYVGPGEIAIGSTFLVRDHWGGATNRELKSLMLAHALRWFDPVIFFVGADNHRSRRAMEKVGARLRPDDIRPFEIGPHVVYEIRRAQR